MNKSDLKSGMRIVLRNGGQYIVIGKTFTNGSDVFKLSGTLEDLTDDTISGFDIMEVYEPPRLDGFYFHPPVAVYDPKYRGELLYKRDNPRMISIKGKEYSEDTLQVMIEAYVNE